MSASFDFGEIDKLAADLGDVAGASDKPIRQALNVTSMKVKKGAQEKVRARKHFSQAASAITFDVTARAGGIESEIGYDKTRNVGKLGNLVEHGAPGAANALAPGNELQRSLHEQEEDFQRGIERAVDDMLKDAGL